MSTALRFGPPVVTVDVEDWPQSTWNRDLPITERSVANTHRMLEVLDRVGVRATMFVLGKLAEKFPAVVREIQAAGHEVASHGYGHLEIFSQTREEFRADVRRGKDLLEQITCQPVRGYRAPDFSIVRRSIWALGDLAELGFAYDSSIFPVQRPRYGIPDWPSEPVQVLTSNGGRILEFPLAAYRALGRNWPVGGGGYNRLLPGMASRWFARHIMQSCPYVFYCHPYELDDREFDEMPWRVPLKLRVHQGLFRSRVESRLVGMLRRLGGRPIVDLLEQQRWPQVQAQSFAQA